MNRLFVYGIFLSERTRQAYGMSNHEYTTVPGFATFGGRIVTAHHIPDAQDLMLTGVTVDVDPKQWGRIDALESGYDRIKVRTTDNEVVWMYAYPGTGDKA